MATYILMGTLTEEGRKTVKERPQRVLEVNKEIESFGARVIAQYVVLGLYDFVTVLQAPTTRPWPGSLAGVRFTWHPQPHEHAGLRRQHIHTPDNGLPRRG